MWWTITGNFGNILPIDWSKSCARKLHVPALNLKESQYGGLNSNEEIVNLSDEDDQVASDLDMHSLILNGLHQDYEPVKTAEEVIRWLPPSNWLYLYISSPLFSLSFTFSFT